MPLNPEVWIPHLEFMLQTISILYPQYPNDVTKKKYYDTIQNLPVFFPQFPIGKEFAKMLDKFPVTPYLSSRESFMKWVHFMNNKLNKAIDEPETEFYESLEKYYDEYKPKELKQQQIYKERKKYIQFAIVVALIGLTIYSYGK